MWNNDVEKNLFNKGLIKDEQDPKFFFDNYQAIN